MKERGVYEREEAHDQSKFLEILLAIPISEPERGRGREG
jgi:hypothetical protein